MKTSPKRLAEIQKSYEEHAEVFTRNTAEEAIIKRGSLLPALRDQFLSYLPGGGRILDIGCGAGRDVRFFEEHGFMTTGVDISRVFIRNLQKRLTGKYVVGDIVDADSPVYKPNFYDGIWSCASIVHLNRKESIQVIKNSYASLKPGGVIYLGTKAGVKETKFERKKSPNSGGVEKQYLYYCQKDLEDDCTTSGFTLIATSFNPSPNGEMFINIFARK